MALDRVLGTLFPEFDALAHSIKRRINHNAISTLPILFGPALLAGVARAITSSDTFEEMGSGTMFRGRKNFDRCCSEVRITSRHVGNSHHL